MVQSASVTDHRAEGGTYREAGADAAAELRGHHLQRVSILVREHLNISDPLFAEREVVRTSLDIDVMNRQALDQYIHTLYHTVYRPPHAGDAARRIIHVRSAH